MTPYGNAIATLVKPGIASALMVSGVRRLPQRKSGNILIIREWIDMFLCSGRMYKLETVSPLALINYVSWGEQEILS